MPAKNILTTSSDAAASPGCWVRDGKTFSWTLCSTITFLIASVLYVWLGVIDWHYQQKLDTMPAEVYEAEDDAIWYTYGWTDDSVFAATPVFSDSEEAVYISRYQLIYSAAAVCFVATGMIEYAFEPGCFGACLLLAGLFGLMSAFTTHMEDQYLALVFNCVSVHLFALEALQLLFYRVRHEGLDGVLLVADVSFMIGTLIDVILSYFALRDAFTVTLATVSVFSACCWLLTAILYVGSTIYIYRQGGFDDEDVNEDDNSLKCNDVEGGQTKPYVCMETSASSDDSSFSYLTDPTQQDTTTTTTASSPHQSSKTSPPGRKSARSLKD